MNPEKNFILGWLIAQWALSIPIIFAFAYLFFSDVHGLPTTGFFIAAGAIIPINSFGYYSAVRALRTWQDN